MQEYHRFVSTKKGNSNNSSFDFQKNNQQHKQSSHNEDEQYLMKDQSESNQRQDEHKNIDQISNDEDNDKNDEEDEVDPLDAFMNTLEQDISQKQKQPKQVKSKSKNQHQSKSRKNHQKNLQEQNISVQNQIQEENQPQWSNEQQEDNRPQIFTSNQYNKNINNLQQQQSNQKEVQQQQFYQNCQEGHQDKQSWTKNKQQKRIIQTLKPFDFGQIQLEDFQKDFYDQHQDIQRLTEQEVKTFRKQMQIKIYGTDIPKPIVSFGHLELDQKMKRVIMRQGFQKPTPIQAQALPVALKGRDLIGVAKTGSGKTLAYVWPMITHVGHQRQTKKGEGPIGLVLAPTRQLCQQIYVQTKKYGKRYDMNVACILGGQNKHQQWKILKAGVDILIASPGRLIEMIKKKATNMFRVTYLVLDQADKMLSLGFQQQIRSIVSQTRPDRQTLLFTATMKKAMQFLAFDILQSPIRINVGQENSANEDVKQQVIVVDEKQQKLEWLCRNIAQLLQEGKILIFCNQKDSCEQIKQFIQQNLSISALTLHGDKSQYERTTIMNLFKTTEEILIATDIAGRGIDVKNIKTIVNFQCPKTIEAYIHRIGRTGRAGETGTAISFLNKSQASIKFSIQLIKIFENSGYPVSKQLEDLACLDDFYRRKRISSKMGVSFAKGKDASKFLNQILKKQQMGNSRAGLGMNVNLKGYNAADKGKSNFSSSFKRQNEFTEQQQNDPKQKTIAEILKQKNLSAQNLSISQLSKIIRQQKQIKDRNNLSSSKLKSHFVRSSEGRIGNYQPQKNQLGQKFMSSSKDNQQEEQQTCKRRNNEVTITYYKGPKKQ